MIAECERVNKLESGHYQYDFFGKDLEETEHETQTMFGFGGTQVQTDVYVKVLSEDPSAFGVGLKYDITIEPRVEPTLTVA